MRIHELEIRNVRGIRQLYIAPRGKTFVVWGPNGSGKSAVVDAIDFLLTGRISRLTGKGTGGMSLSRHGPHVDHTPGQAMVRAKIALPGTGELADITRCMDRPEELVIADVSAKARGVLDIIVKLAERGQHVLSRREILRFITAEAGTRAQDIQELLNLTQVENIRKALVRLANDAAKELQVKTLALEQAKSAVCVTAQIRSFDNTQLLQVVNQNRLILGASAVTVLKSSTIQDGIALPTRETGKPSINLTLLERDIDNIIALTSQTAQEERLAVETELRSLLLSVRADPVLLRTLSRKQLITLGLSLIDDTGVCPLCDTAWERDALEAYLRSKLAQAEYVDQKSQEIAQRAKALLGSINAALASLDKLVAALDAAKLSGRAPALQGWIIELRRLASALLDPIEHYPLPTHSAEQTARLLPPPAHHDLLSQVASELREKYPQASPEQTAWDTLTRLAENLKALETHTRDHAQATSFQLKAQALHDSFVRARDEILTDLYVQISGRFSALYRALHGPDENGFTAQFQPEGPALNFEVDFYGRGTHPPHALHSEGHQDSMGVCLYLALSERLNQGLIQLTILDDVVMSVDANHRRQVCRLLATEFSDRQFLITTHDKTWANQLRSEGLVAASSRIEFYNWTLETGPHVNLETEMWERIESALVRSDVPEAAAKLRRGSEEFFSYLCDSLEAQVVYRLDGRHDLGDFLPAAFSRYKALLRKAKTAAQSWSDAESMNRLQELESVASTIYARTNAEQWAVNASVHFNNWANLSPQDFRNVVEAFQDLHGVFVCQKCGSVFRVVKSDQDPANIRCNCGVVSWNLLQKKSGP